jgi:hypothetical protein
MSDFFSPESDPALTQEHRFEGKLRQWGSVRGISFFTCRQPVEDKLNSRPLPRVKSDGSFDSAAVQFWPQTDSQSHAPRPSISMTRRSRHLLDDSMT